MEYFTQILASTPQQSKYSASDSVKVRDVMRNQIRVSLAEIWDSRNFIDFYVESLASGISRKCVMSPFIYVIYVFYYEAGDIIHNYLSINSVFMVLVSFTYSTHLYIRLKINTYIRYIQYITLHYMKKKTIYLSYLASDNEMVLLYIQYLTMWLFLQILTTVHFQNVDYKILETYHFRK